MKERKKLNIDTQKRVFINIVNNYDLSLFKTKSRYFDNEMINDIFNTIVSLYLKSNKLILDSNVINVELENKYSVDIINSLLSIDISSTNPKWLDELTNNEFKKMLFGLKVKQMINVITDNDTDKIDYYCKELNINLSNENEEDINTQSNNDINKTPLIVESIYNDIPKLLQDITSHFIDREKDVVLMSSLSVLSVLFDTSFMRWKTDKDRPNLMLYIGGSASSGKSKMKFSRMLLTTFLKNESDNNRLLKIQSEQQQSDKKNFEKPILKNILIPANSSSAAFEQKLSNNEGKGLIYTEESSEIGMNKKSDWGNYDNMLRKGFHNETISSNRKDCDIVYIENSYISTCLSGTFDQLMSMFEDKDQNGLFSRFIFYVFGSESKWAKDNGLRFDYNKENDLEKIFTNYSDTVFNIYSYYKDKEIEIDLTKEQCNYFDTEFEKLDNLYFTIYGEKIKPSVNRMGVICRKIMMILSLIRNYEIVNVKDTLFDMINDEKIMVNDIDLKNSIMICKILLEHTSLVFNSFFYNSTGVNEVIMKSDKKSELFELMDNEFSFVQMKEKGEKDFDLKPKSIQRFLKNLVNKNVITHLYKGHYIKN